MFLLKIFDFIKIYKPGFSYLNMGNLKSKRAQMQISFGMIFSIILVIVFLGFAFYAIKAFIGFQNDAKAGKFKNDLQNDINRIWQSSQSSELQEYVVPSNIDFVCFIDFSSDAKGENIAYYSELGRANYGTQNFAFYPVHFTGFESGELKNLDIEKTTLDSNPLCIKTNNGKVAITLKKEFGEALVTISK
jgi:hypothetical protein